MSEWISIQAEQGFVGPSFEHITLSLDIFHLHVDSAVTDSKGGDEAVAIKGYVIWVWGDKWVAHDSIKGTINRRGNLPQNDEVAYFSFQATRHIGAGQVQGLGPLGLEGWILSDGCHFQR